MDRLAVTLDDIKTFRQEGSRCPGHPEYGWTSGVESTTGPLGQGVSTSVGMAIAGAWLAATYNRPDYELFDFNVYALCGDGDMMEGISSEAASLAGHLQTVPICAGCTTATASPSRAIPIWPSPKMSPRALWPMAGRLLGSAIPTTPS